VVPAPAAAPVKDGALGAQADAALAAEEDPAVLLLTLVASRGHARALIEAEGP
jgi:hypothetical protein